MLTVAELLKTLDGELLAGSPETVIAGVASLADAGTGDIAFFANPKYLTAFKRTRASVVLVPRGYPPLPEVPATLVAVESPSLAFAGLVERFTPAPVPDVPGIAKTALLGWNLHLGQNVCIGPYAVIEDGVSLGDGVVVGAHAFIGAGSRIGEGSRLYPHVTIREYSRLGRRVILHSGVVIGSDGFGFELKDGRHLKIPQRGIVQIDDDVEIGANSTVDRARFGRTHIGEGTKIDNLVQVGHNVVIGPHSILCAQVGISGSTRLGSYVTLAGQAGLVGHIEIGDQAVIAAKAGVTKGVPPKTVVFGYPAQPLDEFKETTAYTRRLPQLVERVRKLESELKELRALLPLPDGNSPHA